MAARLALLALIAFVAAELVLRYVFGYGEAFRYITHPQIEYLLVADQDLERRGIRLKSNAYGMRSDQIAAKAGGDMRVLVLGDSVVNGGHTTDHEDLATTVLSRGHATYLNASGVSWGPQNMLAYLETFGTFDADAIVVVLSSHDAWDAPTFLPLDPTIFRTRAPLSIVADAAWRRLYRYLPHGAESRQFDTPIADPPAAARMLLAQPRTCLVLHPERSELEGTRETEGYRMLRAAAGEAPVVDGAVYQTPAGYVDDIHLSAPGQKALAAAIEACAQLAMARRM